LFGASLLAGNASGSDIAKAEESQNAYTAKQALEERTKPDSTTTEEQPFYTKASAWLTEEVEPGYMPCGGVHPKPRWLCIAGTLAFISPAGWALYYLIKDERENKDTYEKRKSNH